MANSLTQIGDVRQLDFIRSFDQVLAETAEDPRADEFLPKAVRTYCAIISHHLTNIDRFEPHVARRLRVMSAAAMKRMPDDLLTEALDSMDLDRSLRLRRLRILDKLWPTGGDSGGPGSSGSGRGGRGVAA